MTKTAADGWFERYLLDNGYVPGEHEPDLRHLGITRTPDFLPKNPAGAQAVCEVKAFSQQSKLAMRLRRQRTLVASDKEVFGPIRNQVSTAAAILRPFASSGMPLVWCWRTR